MVIVKDVGLSECISFPGSQHVAHSHDTEIAVDKCMLLLLF
jgi:hypothetical protein